MGLDVLVDRDGAGFFDWLEDHVNRLGVDHQVCIAHVRKNIRNRLRETDGWDWIEAGIWKLLTELPEGGGRKFARHGATDSWRPRADASGELGEK